MEKQSTLTSIKSNTSNYSGDNRPPELRNHSSNDNSEIIDEPKRPNQHLPTKKSQVRCENKKFQKFRYIENKIKNESEFIRNNLYLVPKYLSYCKSLIKGCNGHIVNDEIEDVVEYLTNYNNSNIQNDGDDENEDIIIKRMRIDIEEDKLVYHLSEKGSIKST